MIDDEARLKMSEAVSAALEKQLGTWKQADGTFSYEIYADYRDEIDNKSATEILEASCPMETFWDKMNEWYFDYEGELRSEIEGETEKELTDDDGPYPDGFTDEEDTLFRNLMMEMLYFAYPEDHYLKQEIYANIMVDTGDGNYDYVLNGVYPSYCGRYEDRIDSKASIVWLAKTQGYTKTQLWKALREGDMANPKGFLESMRVELANVASHMNTLTFLVRMKLEDLMRLNELIKYCEKDGHNYDATKRPYSGYIVIDKNTETGLYDPWSGGGSCFEIELENDVRLPVKYIRSALPDGGDGYSVEEVYGMCGSAWTKGGVKAIRASKKAVI